MYLLGQRWYDSEVGRFISRDPIEEVLLRRKIFFHYLKFLKENIYLYCQNQPINHKDPKGLYTKEDCRRWYMEDLQRCAEWFQECVNDCRDNLPYPLSWGCIYFGCIPLHIVCQGKAYANLINCLYNVEKE